MSRFLVTADWDNNAPHLTEKARKELYDSIPGYQKLARTKGIPQLGAGVVFPFADEELLVDPFVIPDHWPRGYGLDVGWNRTAAIWRTFDPDANPRTHYLIDEYYGAQNDPTVHGAALRKRGLWIPGRIDPAARGRGQDDGRKMLNQYRVAIYGEEDLAIGASMLSTGVNAVESGILAQWTLMNLGLFKVFRNRCPNWMAERRLYRRDEKGRIVKHNDHAMDAGRYNIASGDAWLKVKPQPAPAADPFEKMTRGTSDGHDGLGWMVGM